MKSQFTDHIRQSLENYEAEYNPADWADMKGKLNRINARNASSAASKALIFSAAVIFLTGSAYLFYKMSSENSTAGTAVVSQGIVAGGSQNVVENAEKQIPPSAGSQPFSSVTTDAGAQKIPAVKVDEMVEKKISDPDKTPAVADKKNEIAPDNKESAQNPGLKPEQNTTPLKAYFHTDKNTICQGSAIQFTADVASGSYEYQWDFGDGKTSRGQNPKHFYDETGSYSVKLRVASLTDNRSDEQVVKEMITVNSIPEIELSSRSSSDEKYPSIVFEAKANEVSEWKWDFGDKQTSAEQNPVHAYAKKGTYKVTVTAKSASGCQAVSKKNVQVENVYNLLAPTGFSPNGDGQNDTWLPVALKDGEFIFTITIFDKSGNVAFVTSDKNSPWDGFNTKTGSFVKTGEAFMWVASVKDSYGKESAYEGYIIIAEGK